MDENKRNSSDSQDAWYTIPGNDVDVVLSTKARLSRNLANFPFPAKLANGDGLRVQSLVFDAFNSLENGSSFQAISVSHLDSLGSKILVERGVLPVSNVLDSGVIIRNDGKVSCSVNIIDHLRIMSFVSGFNLDAAFNLAKQTDDGLQKKLQFAASYEFGYLTSCVFDAGSGMKLSLRLHLPCLSILGKINGIAMNCQQQSFEFGSCFGSGSQGAALGNYYQLSTRNTIAGSELDQMALFLINTKSIVEEERKARSECSEKYLTAIRNMVYRSLAITKASLLINLREAIDIVNCIKLGLNMKLLTGIDDNVLNALLYRIQDGHLEYVLKNGDFKFESDILENKKAKNERLRTLILQEAFENVELI